MFTAIFLQGEPGGPLIYRNSDGTWTAVGIVSYDFNPFILGAEETFLACRAGPSLPRAFTRISSYFDWISWVINDGNVTCSSTTESITTKISPITTQSVTVSTTQLTKTSSITPPCTSSQEAATQPGNHIYTISNLTKIIC